jgi:hypothetical protein
LGTLSYKSIHILEKGDWGIREGGLEENTLVKIKRAPMDEGGRVRGKKNTTRRRRRQR